MTKQEMSGEDFSAWIEHMGYSGREAARQLGLANDSVVKYKREGAPLHVALACAALAFGLPPWKRVAPTSAPDEQ